MRKLRDWAAAGMSAAMLIQAATGNAACWTDGHPPGASQSSPDGRYFLLLSPVTHKDALNPPKNQINFDLSVFKSLVGLAPGLYLKGTRTRLGSSLDDTPYSSHLGPSNDGYFVRLDDRPDHISDKVLHFYKNGLLMRSYALRDMLRDPRSVYPQEEEDTCAGPHWIAGIDRKLDETTHRVKISLVTGDIRIFDYTTGAALASDLPTATSKAAVTEMAQ